MLPDNLEPSAVWHYFSEISAIPHGSGNTKAISDYCVSVARKNGLRVRQDAWNNVVIWKDGTSGYESEPTVILQGHLDMVCAKEPNAAIQMETDGLCLSSDGTFVTADGTTLGGDDGIAVAYILAILTADDIPHPPLEAVLTVDEEIGMLGAKAVDTSDWKGRRLINLDSEEEGVLTCGCAGGETIKGSLPLTRTTEWGSVYQIRLFGLKGGHSGVDIGKGRGNAAVLMANLLSDFPVKLISLESGEKDNVIPFEAMALVLTDGSPKDRISETEQALQKTYPALQTEVSYYGEQNRNVLTDKAQKMVLSYLNGVPDGVQKMSDDIPGLVDTSLNLGVLRLDEDGLYVTHLVRSNRNEGTKQLSSEIISGLENIGAKVHTEGDYPAWEYRPNSPLQQKMKQAYRALYGGEIKTEVIHAGLECGILTDKIPDLDAVSIGPNILDIHSVQERMEIASVARVWDYLRKLLCMHE